MLEFLPGWINTPTTVGLTVFAILVALRCGILWIVLSAVIAIAVATDAGGITDKLKEAGSAGVSMLLEKAAETVSEVLSEPADGAKADKNTSREQ